MTDPGIAREGTRKSILSVCISLWTTSNKYNIVFLVKGEKKTEIGLHSQAVQLYILAHSSPYRGRNFMKTKITTQVWQELILYVPLAFSA